MQIRKEEGMQSDCKNACIQGSIKASQRTRNLSSEEAKEHDSLQAGEQKVSKHIGKCFRVKKHESKQAKAT